MLRYYKNLSLKMICHLKRFSITYCYSKFSDLSTKKDVGGSTLVGQRPMKPTLLRLSVRPSVRPSVTKSFFWYCTWWYLTMISSDWQSQVFEKKNLTAKSGPKSGFLSFSWVWIIKTFSRGKNYEKKNWCPNLGQTSQNRVRHFLYFGSLVFIEIAYTDPSRHRT